MALYIVVGSHRRINGHLGPKGERKNHARNKAKPMSHADAIGHTKVRLRPIRRDPRGGIDSFSATLASVVQMVMRRVGFCLGLMMG